MADAFQSFRTVSFCSAVFVTPGILLIKDNNGAIDEVSESSSKSSVPNNFIKHLNLQML